MNLIKKDPKDKVVAVRIPLAIYNKLKKKKVNISATIRQFLEEIE